MRIITISRQFGSGGREFGKRLSEKLGYDYYDREIITSIAEKLKLDEKYIENMSEKIYVEHFNFHFGLSFTGQNDTSIDILKTQTDIIHDIAKKGEDFIIIGRAADCLLKEYKPFNIYVYADMPSKIKRCLDREEKFTEQDIKIIESKIKRIDAQRSKFYGMISDGKWGDKERYNLLINTSNVHIKDIINSAAEYSNAFFNTVNTPFEHKYNF